MGISGDHSAPSMPEFTNTCSANVCSNNEVNWHYQTSTYSFYHNPTPHGPLPQQPLGLDHMANENGIPDTTFTC
ncbi:unnamed protein product [Rodentolepis nana]|uniref:GATA-binding factor A n=1 Tax=Rodentolepis nana TaxID=102285 RepID=A0A0R3TIT9_RODNA|nr:unnamed protein product [Rodentolepis nana]